MKQKVFRKIYNVAKQNLDANDIKFRMSEKAFKSILNKRPDVIDVKEFRELNAEDFLVSSYFRCFSRMPDEIAWQMMSQEACVDNIEEWKCRVMRTIYDSEEFRCQHKKIVGLQEWEDKLYNKKKPADILLDIRAWVHCHIFEVVWNAFPGNVKNCIRAICGKEKK